MLRIFRRNRDDRGDGENRGGPSRDSIDWDYRYPPMITRNSEPLAWAVYFKQRTGPEGANIELHEGVDLPQQDRDDITSGPRECESDRRKATHRGGHGECASLIRCEIPGEGYRCGLLFPHCAPLRSDGIRQDIDRGAGIEEPRTAIPRAAVDVIGREPGSPAPGRGRLRGIDTARRTRS